MPKARIPAVPVQFGGKTRLLVYDFNALAELQDVAGTYASNVAHLKAIRAVLWAGLLAETMDEQGRYTPATLSLVQVGEILSDMEDTEIDAVVSAITKARGLSDQEPNPTQASETPATPTA